MVLLAAVCSSVILPMTLRSSAPRDGLRYSWAALNTTMLSQIVLASSMVADRSAFHSSKVRRAIRSFDPAQTTIRSARPSISGINRYRTRRMVAPSLPYASQSMERFNVCEKHLANAGVKPSD